MTRSKKNTLKLASTFFVIGILLVIVGIGFGANMENTYRTEGLSDIDVTYNEEIESMKLYVDFGTVSLQEGEKFSVQGTNVPEKTFCSSIEDKVWKIEEKEESWFRHFGISFTPFQIGGTRKNYNNIVVTVPKNFEAEELELYLRAGEIIIDKALSKKFTLRVGAGKATVKQLIASEDCDLKVGAGEIEVKDMQVQSIGLDCGAGRIALAGSLFGNGNANCGVGEIEMSLNGNESNFSYAVKCGLGEVKINNKKYGGSTKINQTNQGTGKMLDLKCGVGSIVVTTVGTPE